MVPNVASGRTSDELLASQIFRICAQIAHGESPASEFNHAVVGMQVTVDWPALTAVAPARTRSAVKIVENMRAEVKRRTVLK